MTSRVLKIIHNEQVRFIPKNPTNKQKKPNQTKKMYLKNLGINLRKGKQDSYTAN